MNADEMSGSGGAPHAGRFALPALCLAAGLAGLSVALTRPILVDIAESYRVSVALAGQLMTAASVAGTAGGLFLSPLVDRVGRRELIVLILTVMAAAGTVCAVAPTFSLMMAAYSLVGLGAYTLLGVVLATIGDLYSGPALGRSMGWMVAGNVGLQVLFMPLMADLAVRFSWQAGFGVYVAFALAAAGVVWLSLPRGLKPEGVDHVGYLATFGQLARSPRLLLLLGAIAFHHASVYGFETYVGAVAIQETAATTRQAGFMLTGRSLGMALASVLVGRFLPATDWSVGALAALAAAVLCVTGSLTPAGVGLLSVAAILQAATVGILDVALNSLLLEVEPGRRGAVMALRSVMDGLGGAMGPAIGGAAIALSGYPAAGWAFGLLALGVVVLTALVPRTGRNAEGPVVEEARIAG